MCILYFSCGRHPFSMYLFLLVNEILLLVALDNHLPPFLTTDALLSMSWTLWKRQRCTVLVLRFLSLRRCHANGSS